MTVEDLARRLLADRDPLPPGRRLDPAELRRASALAAGITAEPREAPAGAPPAPARLARAAARPPVLAAAAAVLAVALVAVVVGLPRSGPAYAATPPLLLPLTAPEGPAAPVLERAAAAAAVLPPLGDGSHDYVRTASWYLHTSVGDGRVTSEIVPAITETWAGPDGTVTVADSQGAAQPAGPPGPAGNAEALAALPDHADAEVTRYAPGEHGTGAGELPTDPAALRAALLGNEQVPDGPELIRAVDDVLRTTPVAPAELSALWGALALQPDLVTYGTTTDRAGRRGVAIGIESDAGGLPSRELLLLDPDTGRPLGSEEVLTTDPGLLNVRVPAVIGYEVYLAADRVPAGEVPAP